MDRKKPKPMKWLAATAWLLLCATAWAQEGEVAPIVEMNPLLDPIAWIGLLGPIVVFVVDQFVQDIPPRYRAALAGVIGIALDVATQVMGTSLPPGIVTAITGLGVQIREVFHRNVTRPLTGREN